MDWSNASLTSLPEAIWTRLAAATGNSTDPLRTPALATGAGDDQGLRTVVLRAVESAARQLTAFSDSRAGKIRQLQSRPSADWLFYDAAEKVQFRLRGAVTVHHRDAVTDRFWCDVPLVNRLNYCATVAPGEALIAPGTALPPDLRDQQLTLENTARGWENFAVLQTTVTEIDWLWLRADGHWRAQFRWTDGAWKGSWVAP